MAKVIEVPPIRVAKYHPEGQPIKVLLFDENGIGSGEVVFEDTPEGEELANEYLKFKSDQIGE